MMMHHMAGVADYDWSKWPSTAFPLTEELKTKAAAIADKLTTTAEVQKYFETSSDPRKLKDVVQYAVNNGIRKPKDKSYKGDGRPSPTASPEDWVKFYTSEQYQSTFLTEEEKKKEKETPVLLYALGAAALFLLLRK